MKIRTLFMLTLVVGFAVAAGNFLTPSCGSEGCTGHEKPEKPTREKPEKPTK
jgi:hypothetical protein